MFGLNGVGAHRRGCMRFGVIRTKWWASKQIDAKSCHFYYGHP